MSTEQLGVSSMAIKLPCRPHWPWYLLATLTKFSRNPHGPLGLYQSYTHRTQRPPTVTSSSDAGGHYDGLPTAMCNMLRNIQTEATLTSLPGPPKHTLILLRWGMRHSSKQRKPLACPWKDYSNENTWRCSPQAGEHYTHPLLLFPSTAMKRRPAIIDECVLYAWFCALNWGWCSAIFTQLYFKTNMVGAVIP